MIAEYVREGEKCRLEMDFPLTVSDPQKEGDLMDEDTHEQEEEDEEDEEQGGQEGGSSHGEEEMEEEAEDEDEDEGEEDEEMDSEEGRRRQGGRGGQSQGAHAKVSPERRSKRRRQT